MTPTPGIVVNRRASSFSFAKDVNSRKGRELGLESGNPSIEV